MKHIRARQPGESRKSYADYVRNYTEQQKLASNPKYTQETVKRSQTGEGTSRNSIARSAGKKAGAKVASSAVSGVSGMAASSASVSGMEHLKYAMTRKKKKR